MSLYFRAFTPTILQSSCRPGSFMWMWLGRRHVSRFILKDVVWIKMLPLIFIAIIETGCFVTGNQIQQPFHRGVEFTAEPGYRSVQLKWKYPDSDGPTDFLIKYCEVVWSIKYRCRKRYLAAKDHPATDGGTYRTTIRHLRMSTNYSFTLEPATHSSPAASSSGGRAKLFEVPSIAVTTNGFAAEMSRCVDLWSEIAVRTGPYFGGKITVEDSRDERCSVYGNRSSSRDVYTLRIRHDLCGSRRINNSEIQSTVTVYENRDVVTHNTRRYLVQCNLLPKIFSLRASIRVPNDEEATEIQRVRYPLMDEERTDPGPSSTSNNVRDSRIEAEQTGFVHRTVDPQEPVVPQDQFLILTVVGCSTVLLSLGAALCLLLARRKQSRSGRRLRPRGGPSEGGGPDRSQPEPADPSSIALTSVRCLQERS